MTPTTSDRNTGATPSGSIHVTVSDGVGTLEFAHPKGNSLPGELLRRLAEAIDSLGSDAAVRVVVLRSAGRAGGPFCGGASFDELAAIADEAGGTEFFMGFARVILAMRRCPKLIVSRVHGKVVGGGVGLVAASDYALAAAAASLRLSELAIGIGPFVVGPAIQRRAGAGAFGAMAVDADWRDASWGERHGLYARVYQIAEELDNGVAELASRLAGSSPEAMRSLKAALWTGTEDWDSLLSARAAISGRLVLSEFSQRAIRAAARR